MTMLNSAPTATAAPTGGATPVAVPAQVPQPVAASVPAALAPRAKSIADDVHLLGSGGTLTTGVAADRANAVSVPLDQFARQSGPDASIQTADGMVAVHAIFQVDEKTHQLTVAIVKADGQLVRMIPSESVSRMIAAMATYRGR